MPKNVIIVIVRWLVCSPPFSVLAAIAESVRKEEERLGKPSMWSRRFDPAMGTATFSRYARGRRINRRNPVGTEPDGYADEIPLARHPFISRTPRNWGW